MSSIQEGAIGVPITVTVVKADGTTPLDISGATVKKLRFIKPNGVLLEVDAVFPQGSTGSDGKLQYVSVASDLSPYGTWQASAYIVTPGINTPTQIGEFDIVRSIPAKPA
jgi:hypothetical protein